MNKIYYGIGKNEISHNVERAHTFDIISVIIIVVAAKVTVTVARSTTYIYMWIRLNTFEMHKFAHRLHVTLFLSWSQTRKQLNSKSNMYAYTEHTHTPTRARISMYMCVNCVKPIEWLREYAFSFVHKKLFSHTVRENEKSSQIVQSPKKRRPNRNANAYTAKTMRNKKPTAATELATKQQRWRRRPRPRRWGQQK